MTPRRRTRRRRNPRLALRGALAVLAAGVVLWSVIDLRIPLLPRGGQVVDARLPSAANARVGQPVRVDGVDIGRIDELRAAAGGGVRVRLRIDDDIAVRADATANLRARTLFGRNMYIDLDPGSRSAPPLRGQIPIDATGTQVDPDQLLAPLDDRGRQALRTLLAETADALRSPEPPRAALRLLAPTMRGLDRGIRPLRGTHSGDLPRVVGHVAKVAEAVGASEKQLAQLVEDGASTLGVTAARRADLSRLLRIAPGALANTRRSLARLDQTLDRVDPLVDDLRPGARLVKPAVDAAEPALVALRRTLDRLPPTARELREALRRLRLAAPSARSVTARLQPILARLNERLLPGLAKVEPHTGLKLYEAFGPYFAAGASSAGEYDARGHLMRFQTNGGAR